MTDNVVRLLRSGELDLALIALPAPSDSLETIPLFDEAFLGVFPTAHELTKQKKLKIEQLGRNDLLLLEDGHCLRDQALSLCTALPRPREEGNNPRLATSLEMLWHMIGAGEGFSLIPQLALQNRSDFQNLVSVRHFEDAEARRTIGLAWRSSDPRSDVFRGLAQFLRETTPESCTPYQPA
ncbi:oxidative stress regulatory protein OxyR [Neokomagataea thailandica NBRC 106555]|nr:oxidative stress regulatory protein OxyR [Neokomagataea thailandica NBRC 106555]